MFIGCDSQPRAAERQWGWRFIATTRSGGRLRLTGVKVSRRSREIQADFGPVAALLKLLVDPAYRLSVQHDRITTVE
jgi:hypothetical protein